MVGADTAGLRSLAAQLSTQAGDTGTIRSRITTAAGSVEASADVYERQAAQMFQSRWSDVQAVVRTLEDESRSVASALTTAAGALDRAASDWSTTTSEVAGAGFSMTSGAYPTVTAPAGASDADVTRASQLQQRAQAAVDAAGAAQSALDRAVAAVPVARLSTLVEGRAASVAVSTGDASVDADVDRVVGVLFAAHQTLASSR